MPDIDGDRDNAERDDPEIRPHFGHAEGFLLILAHILQCIGG